MQRKICLVCDTKLGAMSFCPVCKRWVRNPVYMECNYYLNERHSADEKDCSYHRRENPYDRERILNPKKRVERTPEKAGKAKRKNKKKLLPLLLIVAYGLITGMAPFFLSRAVNEIAPESMIERLQDTQLPLPDERCNGYNHFQSLKEELSPVVEMWLGESGYTVTGISDEIYQQEVTEGSEPLTFLNRERASGLRLRIKRLTVTWKSLMIRRQERFIRSTPSWIPEKR